MRRARLHQLLAALCFVAAFSFASRADAQSAMGVCEEILVSLPQPDVRADEGDLCDGAIVVELSGEVPICLLEGASAVAPRPVHDVDGTRVEAGHGSCKWIEAADELTAPHEREAREPSELFAHAWVPPESAEIPAVASELPPALGREGDRPLGVLGRVYRPPKR